MADNYEHPGHDEPQGGVTPGSDFPADFFDDKEGEASGAASGSLAAHEFPGERPSAPPPYPPVAAATSPAPVIPAKASYKPAVALPAEEKEPSRMPVFAALFGLVLLGTLGAAWYLNKQPSSPPPATPPVTTAAAPTPTPPVTEPTTTPAAPATPAVTTDVTDALDGRLKDLAGKVDALTAQVKGYEGKLTEPPKPEPAPDLKPIESKLDDLGKSVGAIGPIGEKVNKLGERFGAVDGELKSFKGELAALRDDVHKAATAPKPAYEAKPATEDASTALKDGAGLFKAGKYKEAGEVFQKLATGNPKDARVYYYSALSRGMTTNDWQGETLATAAKGAELEKSGATKASDVDESFSDLPANLKPWLTYFRASAK